MKATIDIWVGSTHSLRLGVASLQGTMQRSGSSYSIPLSGRHITDGKWHDWDPNQPPIEFIELADPKQTVERPDQWIKPDEWISPLATS